MVSHLCLVWGLVIHYCSQISGVVCKVCMLMFDSFKGLRMESLFRTLSRKAVF